VAWRESWRLAGLALSFPFLSWCRDVVSWKVEIICWLRVVYVYAQSLFLWLSLIFFNLYFCLFNYVISCMLWCNCPKIVQLYFLVLHSFWLMMLVRAVASWPPCIDWSWQLETPPNSLTLHLSLFKPVIDWNFYQLLCDIDVQKLCKDTAKNVIIC
jgi:hypothetical protein